LNRSQQQRSRKFTIAGPMIFRSRGIWLGTVDHDVVLEDPMILILLVAAASTALCVTLALKLVGDI
jgi:hypothetical protein